MITDWRGEPGEEREEVYGEWKKGYTYLSEHRQIEIRTEEDIESVGVVEEGH